MKETIRVSAAMAPTSDEADRFFSTTATSVLWAFSKTIDDIDSGRLPNMEYTPRLYDPLRVNDKTWATFKEEIGKQKPNVLALGSTYDSHHNAVTMCNIARELNSEIVTIYGGPHVKEVAKDSVSSKLPQVYPFNEINCPFDFIIEGDGEIVLPELLRDLQSSGDKNNLKNYLKSADGKLKYSTLPGKTRIHFKDMGKNITKVSTGQKRLDLNLITPIPRQLLGDNPMDLYGFSCFNEINENGEVILLKSTSTLLHRGCQSGCNFCSERGGFNQRSVDHIVSELVSLKSKGIRGVFFDDSTTGDHKNFYSELLPKLEEVGLEYAGLNRFDKLQNSKEVELMRKAGWVYQYCSIEHLSEDVLTLSNKGQGINEIEIGIKNLKNVDMKLGVSLLFGLKGETQDSIRKTLEFVKTHVDSGLITCVSMSLLSFHPNTPQTLFAQEGVELHQTIRFDQGAPHKGYPWNSFEEGRWFHPNWVTEEKVQFIADLADSLLGSVLVRNMRKNGTPDSIIKPKVL